MQEAHEKLKNPGERAKLLKAGFKGKEIEELYIITGNITITGSPLLQAQEQTA